MAGAALSATLVGSTLAQAAGAPERVIVRERAGADLSVAEREVRALGGHVGLDLGIIHGFSAVLPAAGVDELRSVPGVASVEPDAAVRLSGTTEYDPTADPGSLYNTTLATGAQALWGRGYTGRGVDVALIDSGVVPVDGLTTPGKVAEGPDLSLEGFVPSLQHLDRFGHGTHMAGIIAGRDTAAVPGSYAGDHTDFIGMAPDARLVSLKVADSLGNSDVSQLIAAIGWVVKHRHDGGLNIRVLNLSFGLESGQPYTVDPLAAAAEAAWHSGIVVVAAAGNAGEDSHGLADPAADPYLIAAGALDTMGSLDPAQARVASFSNRGTKARTPDLVAPGTHIASLRDPGSTIDILHGSTATTGTRFFRGSGTSQAAAVVSGAAALVLSQRPEATPDQVKALLTGGAAPLDDTSTRLQGAGALRLQPLLEAPTPAVEQSWPVSTGGGSLTLLRRSPHGARGEALRDLLEVLNAAWSGGAWSGGAWSGGAWSGGAWSGGAWSGGAWSGGAWSGGAWSGGAWSGGAWSGGAWSTDPWA
jgi:serine protease AprX